MEGLPPFVDIVDTRSDAIEDGRYPKCRIGKDGIILIANGRFT